MYCTLIASSRRPAVLMTGAADGSDGTRTGVPRMYAHCCNELRVLKYSGIFPSSSVRSFTKEAASHSRRKCTTVSSSPSHIGQQRARVPRVILCIVKLRADVPERSLIRIQFAGDGVHDMTGSRSLSD